MCGRYYFGGKTGKVAAKAFDVAEIATPADDVTPGMSPMVIGTKGNILSSSAMYWGLKNPRGGLIINARAETALQKPMFAAGVENRRLIIPAEKFYEWNGNKDKFTFCRPDSDVIYLAGFYDMSGNREAFVILTTAANDSMFPVHDRMPLMIEEKDVPDWLLEPRKTQEFLRMQMPELVREREDGQMSLFDKP